MLKGARSNDTSLTMNMLNFVSRYRHLSTKRNQGSLEKWLILGLETREHKMSILCKKVLKE